VSRSTRDEASWTAFISSQWEKGGAEVSIGDDACVLPVSKYVVTTDTLVEGVDFRTSWAPPEAVGHKALAANLSDLAAMGASPAFFLLTLCIPEYLPDSYCEGLIRGMKRLGDREKIECCGGDLSSAGELIISITAVGTPVGDPILRSTGREGDYIFISDSLGAPSAALKELEKGTKLNAFDADPPSDATTQALLDRFFRPPSASELGKLLAADKLATCGIDISDGFSMDLHRLCSSCGLGAEVEEETLPIDPLLYDLSRGERLDHALYGGEEQVLLFGVDPVNLERVKNSAFRVTCVGRLTDRSGITLISSDGRHEKLLPKGYDHFFS